VNITGSSILLTGASSGIGAALAPMLAERGATVGLVARRRERLEVVLSSCRRHAPKSRLWVADLADVARAEAVAGEAWDAFGGLDALVNNAAMGKRKRVPDLTPAEIDRVMTLNFTSPMRMGLAVLPRMLARGSGLIVNVGSVGGRFGIPHEAAYCAAKFALSGWSEVMEIDLAGTGVHVKLVLPGPIATEIWGTPEGDIPPLYQGPFVSAEDCAAGIVAALETDGFEHYVPEAIPGSYVQHEFVVEKTKDPDAFVRQMGEMALGMRQLTGRA
jgi:short-subunit dehydrogenase